ncbi:hypothetical protein BDN71DRAFT_1508184 [Pleurotus eryngii]|uniref:Hydrophobin n=1 Tax=Pleurotus eryngii TaxID=5323 RepID=A0A9P5ZU40_PLEER|nr:hypothetical protein BDN71DRAFT_1508184 [Pleurotus eryngii]
MFFNAAIFATAALATCAAAAPAVVARTEPHPSNNKLQHHHYRHNLVSGLLVALSVVKVVDVVLGVVVDPDVALGLTCTTVAVRGSCKFAVKMLHSVSPLIKHEVS